MAALSFCLVSVFMVDGQWNIHNNPSLPRGDLGMAAGYYNHSIYLLYVNTLQNIPSEMSNSTDRYLLKLLINSGGWINQYQMVKYDIVNDEFDDLGDDYLSSTLGNSDGELSLSLYYTQINQTTIFTLNTDGDSINVYDLESLSYQKLDTTIPNDIKMYSSSSNSRVSACIASAEKPSSRLYIMGGGYGDTGSNYRDYLQIFDLDNGLWISNAPSMTTSRSIPGCIVTTDILWVISGCYTDSVESINVIDIDVDITTAKWYEVGSLDSVIASAAVTAVDELIFVIGGDTSCGDTSSRSNAVYTIDTVTNAVSTYTDSLPSAMIGIGVLQIDHTIYGFGGYDESQRDEWITLRLLSQFAIC